MNCEIGNHKNQTHFQPANRLNKPINSCLQIKTTQQDTSGQEMLKIFSDGSHLASIDGNKPSKTKSAVIIYRGRKCVDSFTKEHGPGWSNTAETYAVLDGLNKLLELNFENEIIEWFNDSQCVMYVLSGRYKSHSRSEHYQDIMRCLELVKRFKNITFHWIPREQNIDADLLSKI